MKARLLALATALIAFILPMRGQNVTDLILSEVFVEGQSSVADDYGRHLGWIEIFNKSQGTVNFGGCFLTDDPSSLKKSLIPKGDLRTQLGPRQAAIFFASGRGEDGTFYTGFTLERGKTIYLVSNDGRTIIDTIEIPSDLPAEKSVAKVALDGKEMDFQCSGQPMDPTPNAKNGSAGAESRSQKVAREDPHGFILTIVSVSVVFCALAILWLLFNWLFQKKAPRKVSKKAKGALEPEVAAAIALALQQESGDGVYAAIATALHLYLTDTVHDKESFVITIRPSECSNWSNKALTFRRSPQHGHV